MEHEIRTMYGGVVENENQDYVWWGSGTETRTMYGGIVEHVNLCMVG